MPEGDSALGKVVRRQFQGHFIARKDANAIPAQPASQVGQNYAVMFELYAEQPAGELFQYRTGNFDAVLFAHKPPDPDSGPVSKPPPAREIY